MLDTITWVDTFDQGPLEIRVGYMPEDIPLEDLFDPSMVSEIEHDIRSGELEYFCFVVHAYFEGTEVSSNYLGGCLFTSAERAINDDIDGVFAEKIAETYDQGIDYIQALYKKIQEKVFA